MSPITSTFPTKFMMPRRKASRSRLVFFRDVLDCGLVFFRDVLDCGLVFFRDVLDCARLSGVWTVTPVHLLPLFLKNQQTRNNYQ